VAEIFDHHIGLGNWHAFNLPFHRIREAAARWKNELAGIERPWLCWHVNNAWTVVQQRLVQSVGWTPVIGFDPRFPAPTPLQGSVVVDFNREFGFPILYMHFPLEFVFLYAERMAFWHSDLLCRLSTMESLGRTFNSLRDKETAAVLDRGGRRNVFRPRRHRYWELVGCTTQAASEDQFRHGTGWWQRFDCHPNCPSPAERTRREKYYWDHGVGIMYWKKRYSGLIREIPRSPVEEGHCTSINRQDYKRLAPISQKLLGEEITLNYSLESVAERLAISHLL
jgi:hypothetical protein